MGIYYSVGYGLQGCYLDDSKSGCYEINSRRELCDMIRGEIEVYSLPKSCFEQVSIRKLWAYLKKHGASNAPIYITHKHNLLTFYGLTESEFNEQNQE